MAEFNGVVMCDTCGRGLTTITGMPGYRWALVEEPIRLVGAQKYAIEVKPFYGGLMRHFCNLACLTQWTKSVPRCDL